MRLAYPGLKMPMVFTSITEGAIFFDKCPEGYRRHGLLVSVDFWLEILVQGRDVIRDTPCVQLPNHALYPENIHLK